MAAAGRGGGSGTRDGRDGLNASGRCRSCNRGGSSNKPLNDWWLLRTEQRCRSREWDKATRYLARISQGKVE
jgi:hypothetical protein